MNCKNCSSEIDVSYALSNSPFCWPELQAIWHVCVNCNVGNHIRFIKGQIQLIEIIGAPGPDWKIIQNEKDDSVSIRIDPGYFHVWYKKNHYEIEPRK